MFVLRHVHVALVPVPSYPQCHLFALLMRRDLSHDNCRLFAICKNKAQEIYVFQHLLAVIAISAIIVPTKAIESGEKEDERKERCKK